jgi:glucose-1-phosphate thymidylyltransferase
MWAIVPAAGYGTRIQPLAFSKELLPLCDRSEVTTRRPRAVSDYLLERLALGGADRICIVISPGKGDIVEFHGGSAHSADLCYAVQPRPAGLCDAIFRALPFIDLRQPVLVGLPDTIWFPSDALRQLPGDRLSFLLFPVSQPERFDAVLTDDRGRVLEIQVKQPGAKSNWIWGAFKMPGTTLAELFELWCRRDRADEFIGTLVNAWLKEGGSALGIPAGTRYHDIGTMAGYVEAMRFLYGADADREEKEKDHDTVAT